MRLKKFLDVELNILKKEDVVAELIKKYTENENTFIKDEVSVMKNILGMFNS